MLRLRRRAAEGSASAGNVNAYMTGLHGPGTYTASLVTVNSDGSAARIPDRFFASGYEEARALATAIRARRCGALAGR